MNMMVYEPILSSVVCSQQSKGILSYSWEVVIIDPESEGVHEENGFKQVQKAYLALISYLVQPSYMLSAQISPLATPWAC